MKYWYNKKTKELRTTENANTIMGEEFNPITEKEYVIKSMLNKYGVDSQLDVAVEEMAELTKELIKYKRSKIHFFEKQDTQREKVLEELGDVFFMFEYIKEIFQLTEKEIEDLISTKASRTHERYLK